MVPNHLQSGPMPTTVVLGLPTMAGLVGVVEPIAQALAMDFELHDSSFWGGDYYLGRGTGEPRAYLFPNHDILDNTPFYEEAPDCPLLLRLDDMDEPAEALAGLIRHVLAVPCRILELWPT